MTETDIDYLRELIQTLNEGAEFYRVAIDKSEYPAHKIIFERVLRSRSAVLAYLQPYLTRAAGTPETGHTFGSVLHKMYPEILYGLNGDHDQTLIRQLETVESTTLGAMQKAMQNIESAMLKSVLLDLYPRLNRCKQDLWQLDRAC